MKLIETVYSKLKIYLHNFLFIEQKFNRDLVVVMPDCWKSRGKDILMLHLLLLIGRETSGTLTYISAFRHTTETSIDKLIIIVKASPTI